MISAIMLLLFLNIFIGKVKYVAVKINWINYFVRNAVALQPYSLNLTNLALQT